MRARITAIILGVVTIVIGLIVSGIVDSQAALSGDTAIRCTAAAANSPTFTLISKGADACTASSGLAAGDFRVPTPTSAQLTELNKATSVASSTNVASFNGAKQINDLLPLIVRVMVLMVGVGMIGIGGAGFTGHGPLREG